MKKVLVVEDDAHLRRLLRVVLSGKGFEVLEAEDGEKGLALALTGGIDCILSDAMMPKMGGLEMLTRLRSQRPGGPPALFVTAVAQMPSPEERDAAGIVQTVAKPFDFDRIVVLVKKWTEGDR